MEILLVFIGGVVCPLIVHFVISKHKTKQESIEKPSKSGMPNLNKLIKDIQEIADKPFK
jgi:hypothetical protein